MEIDPRTFTCTARSGGHRILKALAKHSPDLVFRPRRSYGDARGVLAADHPQNSDRTSPPHDVTTLGAYDEQCRHAITKMSHVHFAALPEHAHGGSRRWAKRRQAVVGALAADGLRGFPTTAAAEIHHAWVWALSDADDHRRFSPRDNGQPHAPIHQIDMLLSAIDASDLNMLLIGPELQMSGTPF